MGNRSSRRRTSGSESAIMRKKAGKRNSIDPGPLNDKHASCPPLGGGAVPYQFGEDRPVNVRLYRSFRNPNKYGTLQPASPEIRIYRRSSSGLHARTSVSLPRQFGRSKSAVETPLCKMTAQPKAATLAMNGGPYGRGPPVATPTTTAVDSKNQHYPVSAAEYPTTEDIRQKLSVFEERFCRCLVDRYRRLPEGMQLTSLPIAFRKRKIMEAVSLYEYLTDPEVPMDLLSPAVSGVYTPIIATSLFHGLHHVRRDKLSDCRLWTSLARDIVTCIALETANELSRIYEYQIAVLRDAASVEMLAEHAAACVIAYVVGEKTSLDRNSAILGVIRARVDPQADDNYVSVLVGANQMRWKLQEILVKPGLRKDVNLHSDEYVNGLDSSASQWHFYTTNFHNPATYGYRAQLLEWDYLRRMYKRSLEDEYFYTDQTEQLSDENIHWRYRPYKRLLGVDCMKAYCANASNEHRANVSLSEFLKTPADDASGRREIQPVYRPLTSRTENTRFDNVILDNVDLTRVQLDSSHAKDVKARNAKLLLAEFRDTKIEAANLSGSDISYSNVNKAIVADDLCGDGCVLRAAPPRGKARHISLDESVFRRQANSADGVDGDTRKRVSDADGNIVYVCQVVEKRQQQLEAQSKRRERRAKTRSASTSSAGSQGPGSPPLHGVTNGEHHQQQQRVKRTHSAAERRLRSQHSHTQSQPDCRVACSRPTSKPPPPPPNGRAVSAPYIEPEVHTTLAMPTYAPAPGGATQRSLSSTYIHGVTPPSEQNENEALHPAPRHMVKSASHHEGMTKSASRNASLEAYGLSLYTGRRTLSQAEVEFIRRSQVFRMINRIHIENLPDDLPPLSASFAGRDADVDTVCNLVNGPGQLVTITGSIGVGKSAQAVAVGHASMQRHHVTPRYVDTRGCATCDAVIARLMTVFGLRFRPHEMNSFYTWLSSHEQRFLIIFDNIEVGDYDIKPVSRLIDDLLAKVPDTRVLCTSRTCFYEGDNGNTAKSYALSDLSSHSESLLRRFLPDLHEEGIIDLANACGHVAFSLVVAAKSLVTPNVDVGQLYEALTSESMRDAFFTNTITQDTVGVIGDNEERIRTVKVLYCVKCVMDHLPGYTAELLSQLSVFSSWFSVTSAWNVVCDESSTEEQLSAQLTELVDAGLLIADKKRYYMPDFVKLAAKASYGGDLDETQMRYCNYFMARVNTLSEQFNSRRCYDAIVDFRREADDITNALRAILEQGTVFESCGDFANVNHAMLLYEALSEALYVQLYEMLECACAERDEVSRRCRALCCLAYGRLQRNNFTSAKEAMQRAHDVSDYLNDVDELTKAFVFHCLGKVYFADATTSDQGMALTKRARDVYARLIGMRSARALLANEDYGVMATKRRWFASAHHCYNLSNLIDRGLLDGHIALIASYDSRRSIWDSMLLFARATDAGRRAVAIARRHYGEHPLTATMTANLCDAVMKRGSLNEAIEVAVDALALRIKVLGEHLDTAASYKVLAYLMLRSGQYDESVRFGESALELYTKLDAKEKSRVEVKNIIAQARYRLEYKSSVFVELESKDASKKTAVTEEIDNSFRSSISTEV